MNLLKDFIFTWFIRNFWSFFKIYYKMEMLTPVCCLCEIKSIHPYTEPYCEFNNKKICSVCIEKLTTSVISVSNKPIKILTNIPEDGKILIGPWEKCETHNHKLRLLCINCNKNICVLCVPSHSLHSFSNIEELISEIVPKLYFLDFLSKYAEKDFKNNLGQLKEIQEALCSLFARVQDQPAYWVLKKCDSKIKKLTTKLCGLVVNYSGKNFEKLVEDIKNPKKQLKRCEEYIHWAQWNSQFVFCNNVADSTSIKITLPADNKIPHFAKSIQISSDSILVCGGRDQPTSNGLRRSFIIKVNPITVEPLPDMNSGRANHCVLYYNRYVYVIGGCDHENRYTNRAERLSLTSLQWEEIASCNEIRDSSSGVGVEREDSVYVFGGRKANAVITNTIEKYIVCMNIWVSLPIKLTYESMVLGSILVSPTQVLVFAGQNILAQPLKQTNIIDLEKMTVRETRAFETAGGCVVNEPLVFNGKVFCFIFEGNNSRSIETWRIEEEFWEKKN